MQEQQSNPDNKKNEVAKRPLILQSFHDKDINYDELKKEAIKNSPMVATYPLSIFELGRNKTIKMDGKLIPITSQAYSSFLKRVLHIDPKFVKRFKSVTDEKTEISMLQTLKTGMAHKKDLQVHVLANPLEKSITNFATGNHAFRTNEQLLTIFENVINKYNVLKVRDFHMNSDGTLNIAARTEEMSVGPNNFKDEAFRGGLTFRNSYSDGSSIGHNAFRQICENGMFGFNDLPLFVGPSNKPHGSGTLIDFFEKLELLNKHNWMAEDFWGKMEDAMETKASVAELMKARNTMLVNSELKEKDLRAFLPQYYETRNFLAKHRINMEELDNKKMVNCPANINIWELINIVTDFGSHDYGFNADFDSIQKNAGKLFAKQYDTKNLVILE